MLDSEHSTVTYTSISSDDGSSDVGSSRVIVLGYDGLPMMPKDPYAYVKAAMLELPSLYFVSEPVYPKFMPPKDDVFLAEEQPLPIAKEESSEDNANEVEEDEGEEEEEHLAPADSVSPPAYCTTARMSIRAQTPIPFLSEVEVNKLIAIPTLPPSPLKSYSSLLPQIPSPPLPTSLTDAGAPLGYRDAMIRLRAESPSTSHPLPLLPPIVLQRTRAFMVMMRAAVPSTYILTPRQRHHHQGHHHFYLYHYMHHHHLCFYPLLTVEWMFLRLHYRLERGCVLLSVLDLKLRSAYLLLLLDPLEALEQIMVLLALWMPRLDDIDVIYGRLDDAQDDRLLMSGQLNLLHRDRRSHTRTTRLMESEARASREAWVQSMDASDMTRYEKMVLAKRATRASPTMTTTPTLVTNAQLKTVGQDAAHSMPWSTLMKMMTAKYCPRNKIKKLEIDIWELKVKGIDVASYTQRFQELALMYGKMFLEDSAEIEKYVGGLPDMIHRSVMASKPKTMHDAFEFSTELKDKKIHTFLNAN
uniref:Reverse transcriptase domain-containing protein n=1 Tax=Tanacetum cinerariifolium TaxID=118510 RepID=A0A699H6S6_TANCI|nr:reverse transcriptase domain-containing protein [Tanacetum cinerariifolium]